MLNLATVLAALTVEPVSGPNQPFTGTEIDSRAVKAGQLFVAFRGERVDGHDYVDAAFAAGAAAALVSRPVERWPLVDLRQAAAPDSWPAPPYCLLVEDTLVALQAIAANYRRQFNVRIIGITGSVGKTTTKELVQTVLARRFMTLKSVGNRNNELGLPLTLLNLRPSHQRVVLEMGMYARGEIRTLCEIARPDVGIVTNIGPVHLSRLGTMEAIVAAKQELVEALPTTGAAILNRDDDRVMSMAAHTPAPVLTYGLDDRADVWADNIQSMGLDGIYFDLHHRGTTLRINVPLIGRHSVHTALRAAAVGLVEGLTWDDIVTGLQTLHDQLRLVAVEGPDGSIVLDDTYNASPASVLAALNLLADLNGRRVAVLGDMLELGTAENSSHRLVGRRARLVAQVLLAVGPRGRLIGEEALAAGMPSGRVHFAADAATAAQMIPDIIQPGDAILVKASRGLGLDQVVSALAQAD